MEEIQIINLKPYDWQKYKDLRLRALLEEPYAFSSTYGATANYPNEYWKKRLEEVTKNNNQWFLFAQHAKKIVGMIGAFAEKEIDNAHIVALYVIPEMRGKGISKLLMRKLLAKIKTNELVKKITVDVNPEQLPAIKLYENSGFQITKKYRMVLGDGKVHDVYQLQMQVEL